MPRKKTRSLQPANVTMQYLISPGASNFVDLAQDLSRLNRRLYRQGMQYAVQSVSFVQQHGTAAADIEYTIRTAGNTWVAHNAWKKSFALWREMNKEVLKSNPSVEGRWADFKIYLHESQAAANTIHALTGSGGAWPTTLSEWTISKFVVPQHDVDPVSGNVLPAEEWVGALVGPDDVANKRFGIIKAYEESRATVQDDSPNTPALLPASFYLQLQDDGSQDPELALVIQDSNETPPYSNTPGNYPGGDGFTGVSGLYTQQRVSANVNTPTVTTGGFTAECGLMLVNATSSTADDVRMIVKLVPGPYKGVLARPMGQ